MPESDGGMTYRISEVERRIGRVEELPTKVAAIDVKIDNLHEDQKDIRESFKSLRTALLVFALSIAGSAVTFGFAVLQLTK